MIAGDDFSHRLRIVLFAFSELDFLPIGEATTPDLLQVYSNKEERKKYGAGPKITGPRK